MGKHSTAARESTSSQSQSQSQSHSQRQDQGYGQSQNQSRREYHPDYPFRHATEEEGDLLEYSHQEDLESLERLASRENPRRNIPHAGAGPALAIRGHHQLPYRPHASASASASFANTPPWSNAAAARLAGSSPGQDSGYGSYPSHGSYPSGGPRSTQGRFPGPSPYGSITTAVYSQNPSLSSSYTSSGRNEEAFEPGSYGFRRLYQEPPGDFYTVGRSPRDAGFAPWQSDTPRSPIDPLSADGQALPPSCSCGLICQTSVCPCKWECAMHAVVADEDQDQAYQDSPWDSRGLSVAGEEFGEPNSAYARPRRASRSGSSRSTTTTSNHPNKRSSKSQRGARPSSKKGGLTTFNVYFLGPAGEGVTAYGVVDPAYDGPPLLSNALAPRLAPEKFVPFSPDHATAVTLPSLGETVYKSGGGMFTYSVPTTDGDLEPLSDKLDLFEGKLTEEKDMVFGASWRVPVDLDFEVWWIGKGKKKDKGKYTHVTSSLMVVPCQPIRSDWT
ncbi:hypothetical protein ACHAQA_007995 [Verticillium albo-atrum]